MILNGAVVDNANGNGIPSATVSLRKGSSALASTVANSYGVFTLSTNHTPDLLVISSVGFKTKTYAFPLFDGQSLFFLDKDVKELDPVIVTAAKKNKSNSIGLFLLALVTLKALRG